FFPSTITLCTFSSSSGTCIAYHMSLSMIKNKDKRQRSKDVFCLCSLFLVLLAILLELLSVDFSFVLRQVNLTQTYRLRCHLDVLVCLDVFHTFFQRKFDRRSDTYVVI